MVEPGWQAAVTGRGDLLLTRPGGRPVPSGIGTDDQQGADPVMLEIFNNLFMSVAEQMGVRLQSTAHSVNIKERLDFSCAVFDAAGQLIANAPHMPVHLGSMGESIKMIISRNPGAMKPGDVFMLNDPYHGGTHLPDITVVTPVFSGDGPDSRGAGILFFVASRGHHAEIGGVTPGSMPAFSTRVDEEGVLIDNWRLVERGEMRQADHGPVHLGGVPVPEPPRRPRRPAGPDRGEREGRRRAAQAGQRLRPGRGDRVHGLRPGQRGGGGAPRPRPPE